ncbi:fused MFS/spermidine synthase [Fibrivirga algicola]|uniref:Spermine synthase n=1 Tax=Fibrivirga algicola TaxID=2950420 RepID=A0ABX0QMM1_9BACT|nr:fused MFS/spermidine synthase [Fibrivirga algicola]NID13028.1 spermine synthase [Fibrivirga algicola]
MITPLPVTQERQSISVPGLLFLFFVSGFAALLYQIIWQRLLVFYTGSDTVSVSLIVTAFMTGLGVGYLVGGRLADRSTARQNLRYFIGAEVGILLFALCSKFILYDLLYASAPSLGNVPVLLYTVVVGVLILPTFLMGVSLPVLSRAFRFGNVGQQARYISLLYFVNTLGAAFGALVTGFVFVRQLGYDQSLWVGAACNGLCVVSALLLSGRQPSEVASEKRSEQVATPFTFTPALTAWSVHYALSGFAALSLELIWFRILETLIKSVSLTFAVLLAIYLGSMAIGTAAGTYLCRSAAQRTAAWRERAFLLAQVTLYAYTAVSMAVFINVIDRLPALRFLWDYFGSYEPTIGWQISVYIYGAVPLFLLFVPTFLMGLSFSLSQSLVQTTYSEVGRRVGWLQFINIIGSAVGAWATTWVGFPSLGTAVLLKIIALFSLLYLLLLLVRRYWAMMPTVLAAGALVGVLMLIPGNDRFWQVINGVSSAGQFLYHENESAVSVIKLAPDQKSGIVFVNGLGQSGMPYLHDEVHTLLGALPVLIHPNPRRVAVIGLGSAGTVNGIAGRAETKRIDCFEIASNQALVLAKYATRAGDTAVWSVLGDPRLHLIFRDGRYAIRNQAVQYDVIEADALRPSSAFSGNIYSKEYFELLRSRLAPQGLAVTWCPTVRVLNTFRLVFPYVAYCDKLMLIGSNQPISLNWPQIDQRAASAFSQHHYGRSGIAVEALLAKYKPTLKLLPRLTEMPKEINTDLFPKDEYSLRGRDKLAFD